MFEKNIFEVQTSINIKIIIKNYTRIKLLAITILPIN